MKLLRKLLTWCVAIGALSCAASALAADAPQDLVLKGDAACTVCHDDSDAPELLAIGKTRHGTLADPRTPTCTSCHGASTEHLSHKGSGKPPKPDVTFGAKTTSTADARNGACLDCHTKDAKRSHWDGSTHQARDVTCSACHKVHVAKDKVRDKATQAEVCFACHKEQRALANKPSHHPVAEGKMACSDCHNAHGSTGPSLMKRSSVTETCYTCHMEKRGPFVHNHQPVAEDCSICHNPHGTTAESMLKSRPPFLCNTCHTPHGPIQPTLANGSSPTIAAAGWWNPSIVTQGKSCVSCHAQIHGSNNPTAAGQRFFR
jgi:DmsE family decaheme c-type cytochrome